MKTTKLTAALLALMLASSLAIFGCGTDKKEAKASQDNKPTAGKQVPTNSKEAEKAFVPKWAYSTGNDAPIVDKMGAGSRNVAGMLKHEKVEVLEEIKGEGSSTYKVKNKDGIVGYVSGSLLYYYVPHIPMNGTICGDDVLIREAPSTDARILGSLNKGYTLPILEEVRTGKDYPWFKIRTGKGLTGYTYGQFIDIEQPSAGPTKMFKWQIPAGFKVVKANDYNVAIECLDRTPSGGPQRIYDPEGLNLIIQAAKECVGNQRFLGAIEDETISILFDGRIEVSTILGSKRITRYYKNSTGDFMDREIKDLLIFKYLEYEEALIRTEGNDTNPCMCGKRHVVTDSKGQKATFRYTGRDGLRLFMKENWK